MLTPKLSILFIFSSLILAIFLLYFSFKISEFEKIKVKKRKKSFINLWVCYKLLKKLYICSKILKYVESGITSYRDYVSYYTRTLATKLVLALIFINFVFILVLINIKSSVSIIFGFIFALFFINKAMLDYIITKENTSTLVGLVDFLDIYMNKYYEANNMPDEALLMSIKTLDKNRYEDLIIEIQRIYNVISSPNSDIVLNEYYEMSKNNYFKLFAGIIYITMENGDTKSKDVSTFISSLSMLSSDIKEEIILREKLNFALKSLNIIALIPLFLVTPLKNWASESFYPLNRFYSSHLGFKVEVFVILATIVAYIFLDRIQTFSSLQYSCDDVFDRLLKNKFLGTIVNIFMPINRSKRYKKIMDLKIRSLSADSIEKIYLKKLLFALFLAVFATIFIIFTLHLKKQNVLYMPTPPNGYLGGELVGRELELAKIRTDKDRKILKFIESGASKKEIVKLVSKEYLVFKSDSKKILDRVFKKYKIYRKSKFSFIHIFIVYVGFVLGFIFYNYSMKFKKGIVRIDSITEIAKFQLIILMLMQSKNISIEDLLVWMERFSLSHKEILNRAIMNYDSGSESVLHKLKNLSLEDEFRKIVDHLLSVDGSVSIKVAFSELENEKKYYEEKRKITYRRIIDKKISLGRIFGFVPIYSLILVYFMLPLVYVSISEMNEYFKVLY